MPLTKTGKKVKRKMKQEYGVEKGESVFYASINAKKPGTEDWHMMEMDNSPIGRHSRKKRK
jgi:hypothetical protein